MKLQNLIEKSIEIQNYDLESIGFICRSMVSASMPHSKFSGLVYKRENQKFHLSIIGNPSAGGIPYGTYPRLLLSWIASEVVRTQKREIILGDSLSNFMKKMGLCVTGGRNGTLSRFKDQLRRLFSSTISITYVDEKEGKWLSTNMTIADKVHLFWDPSNPENLNLFKSKIFLNECFYKEILNSPIPVDIRAINALKDSSLSLDIYFWLTYRMNYLKKPLLLSFEKLHAQFGAGYDLSSHGKYEFKRKFLHQLKQVLIIYPEANVKIKTNGIELFSSHTHIKNK